MKSRLLVQFCSWQKKIPRDISRNIWNFSLCFKIIIYFSVLNDFSCNLQSVLRNSGWEILLCQVHLIGKGKGKAIPLQAWRDPEGYMRCRLLDFKTVGT